MSVFGAMQRRAEVEILGHQLRSHQGALDAGRGITRYAERQHGDDRQTKAQTLHHPNHRLRHVVSLAQKERLRHAVEDVPQDGGHGLHCDHHDDVASRGGDSFITKEGEPSLDHGTNVGGQGQAQQ